MSTCTFLLHRRSKEGTISLEEMYCKSFKFLLFMLYGYSTKIYLRWHTFGPPLEATLIFLSKSIEAISMCLRQFSIQRQNPQTTLYIFFL